MRDILPRGQFLLEISLLINRAILKTFLKEGH